MPTGEVQRIEPVDDAMEATAVNTLFQEVDDHSRSKVFLWSMTSVKIGIVGPMDTILPGALVFLSCSISHAPLHGAVPGLQAWFWDGPQALTAMHPAKSRAHVGVS